MTPGARLSCVMLNQVFLGYLCNACNEGPNWVIRNGRLSRKCEHWHLTVGVVMLFPRCQFYPNPTHDFKFYPNPSQKLFYPLSSQPNFIPVPMQMSPAMHYKGIPIFFLEIWILFFNPAQFNFIPNPNPEIEFYPSIRPKIEFHPFIRKKRYPLRLCMSFETKTAIFSNAT